MTPGEVVLWQVLRRKGLGVRFRRQHPIGPYVVDFACVPARLVVEVDGYAHTLAQVGTRDVAREAWLRRMGWTVVRYPEMEVRQNLSDVVDDLAGRV